MCVCVVNVGEVLPTGKHVSEVFASLSSTAAIGSEDTVCFNDKMVLWLEV